MPISRLFVHEDEGVRSSVSLRATGSSSGDRGRVKQFDEGDKERRWGGPTAPDIDWQSPTASGVSRSRTLALESDVKI